MIGLDVFWRDRQVWQFRLTGHAGYDESGYDIVCAAVSALVYNAINSCEQFVGVVLQVRDRKSLQCVIPHEGLTEQQLEAVQLLIQSMVFGVRQIEYQYSEYVSVVQHEAPEDHPATTFTKER
jgi:uncharacterized protein YsxB (DUF464 family)